MTSDNLRRMVELAVRGIENEDMDCLMVKIEDQLKRLERLEKAALALREGGGDLDADYGPDRELIKALEECEKPIDPLE